MWSFEIGCEKDQVQNNLFGEDEQYFVAIIVQICFEKIFSKFELLVFPVLESRNSVEKRLCKFEAKGREFVTFSSRLCKTVKKVMKIKIILKKVLQLIVTMYTNMQW